MSDSTTTTTDGPDMGGPDMDAIDKMTDKPAGTPNADPPKAAETQTVKVKVNGVEKELTHEQLLAHAQKHLAGEDKLREAAETLKAYESLKADNERLRTLAQKAYNEGDGEATLQFLEAVGANDAILNQVRERLGGAKPSAETGDQPEDMNDDDKIQSLEAKFQQELGRRAAAELRDDTWDAIEGHEDFKAILEDLQTDDEEADKQSKTLLKNLIAKQTEELLTAAVQQRVKAGEEAFTPRVRRAIAAEVAKKAIGNVKSLRRGKSTHLGRSNTTAQAAPVSKRPTMPRPTGDAAKDREAQAKFREDLLRWNNERLGDTYKHVTI